MPHRPQHSKLALAASHVQPLNLCRRRTPPLAGPQTSRLGTIGGWLAGLLARLGFLADDRRVWRGVGRGQPRDAALVPFSQNGQTCGPFCRLWRGSGQPSDVAASAAACRHTNIVMSVTYPIPSSPISLQSTTPGRPRNCWRCYPPQPVAARRTEESPAFHCTGLQESAWPAVGSIVHFPSACRRTRTSITWPHCHGLTGAVHFWPL